MSHGSATPSTCREPVILPTFPRLGPMKRDLPDGSSEEIEIDDEISTPPTRSIKSGRKVYPLDCPSYNPLVAVAATVQHILDRRLQYEEDVNDIRYFEVRNGQGRHYVEEWDSMDEKTRAIVFFLQWRTVPSDSLHLSSKSFRNLLLECDVNPLFVDMLGFPNTGGAGSSFSYSEEDLDAFHLYIRYPHTYPEYECARYLRYSFPTKQTVVISMEGHGTVSSRTEYIFDQLLRGKQSEPQNPFSYLVPFIVQMGHAMDDLRSKQRDEVIFIEKSTDTGEIDPFQIGARNLDNITHLTRLAHLRSASTARLMKLLKFHIRAVNEVIKGFQKFENTDLGEQPGEPRAWIESRRLGEILDQELDLCLGREMETENLVKRTDIQINVLMSLAAQKDSNVNKRIAEQSKQIALETRRDSEAMKTIAILTMLFLPGTFVSAFLGMNFFDGENGHFRSDGKWWIFLAVTIPLTIIVVGSWFAWVFWKRRRAEGGGDDGSNEDKGYEIPISRGGDTRRMSSATAVADGAWNS
ncbi:hypothetical protein FQN54_001719 [Arachnomyces sp. PD_36]|nr:hypothetical protein FQN54_001719 [Arachnomyces sp. PD_36]